MNLLTHPATVHIPLALTVLFPIFYITALWATMTKRLPDGIWYGLCVLGGIQICTSLLAYSSGETSKILSAAAPEQIARHEQFGVYFIATWFAIFAILILVTGIHRKTLWRVTHGLLLSLLFAQLALGVLLGKLGGTLVMH